MLKKSEFTSEKLKPIGRISKKWKMPLGMNEHQIFTLLTYMIPKFEPEDKCLEDNCGCNSIHLVGDEEIFKFWDMILTLNPELGRLEIDVSDVDSQWIVLFGVISRYSLDDIEAFLGGHTYSSMDPDDINIVLLVQGKLKISLGGYCPSPKTIKKMKKWLKKNNYNV
jgi:hypothetical protein